MQREEELVNEGMFRHTFSIDKPIEPLPHRPAEPEVKMNIFEFAFAAEQKTPPIL
jgi:hypothetical protein